MILKQINLVNFRNVKQSSFSFTPSLTVILGENAQGKTNLLESIYFSVNGVGFRESKEEELIFWGESDAMVESAWDDEGNKVLLQIILHKKGEGVDKKFSVQKTQKTHNQYQDYQTRAVLFAPEHIDIIAGSPDKRREYFNRVISIFDKEYKRKLTNYEHALRKRNKVLEHFRDENTLKEELSFWNQYLEEQAVYITLKRQEYMQYLNQHTEVQNRKFEIEYLKNELTKERLESRFDEEKKWRKTSIGPQKDDFVIYQTEDQTRENIHLYGSRSEQRLGVFWLKLNEIQFLEEFFKKKPILLLDDVFSELDQKNKKLVLELVYHYQTVITTTEEDLVDLSDIEKSVIRI